jgi:hypothetical protein
LLTGFSLPAYSLKISATDTGVPAAVSYFQLNVSVLNTTFLSPTATTTCFLDTVCKVIVRPSYTNRAESLLLAVDLPTNRHHSHVIGSYRRSDSSSDLYYSLDGKVMYLDWIPTLPMERSDAVTLTARSPNGGSDESVGTSDAFLIEYPFQFAATSWGSCVPDGKGGGKLD